MNKWHLSAAGSLPDSFSLRRFPSATPSASPCHASPLLGRRAPVRALRAIGFAPRILPRRMAPVHSAPPAGLRFATHRTPAFSLWRRCAVLRALFPRFRRPISLFFAGTLQFPPLSSLFSAALLCSARSLPPAERAGKFSLAPIVFPRPMCYNQAVSLIEHRKTDKEDFL